MEDRAKRKLRRGQNMDKLEKLVSRVQEGSLEAGGELFRFVMESAEPYLQSTVSLEDIESELEAVVTVAWDAIRNGALRKPEYLPSFVQTLIWQQVRRHLNQLQEPPVGTRLVLIPGGRKRRSPHPLLAPQ